MLLREQLDRAGIDAVEDEGSNAVETTLSYFLETFRGLHRQGMLPL